MKTSASSAESAHIGPKSWRSKFALSVRVAPLGLACALLLYVASLEIDGGFGFLNQVRSGSNPMPLAEVEHALAAVRTSMVELPGDEDARAIAHFATATRMIRAENRELVSVVRKLETRYADIVRRYEANLAAQQENINSTQSKLDRLQHHDDTARTQVAIIKAEQIERQTPHFDPKDGGTQHNLGEKPDGGLAFNKAFATKTLSPQSWISNTGLYSELSARFAGLQIARRLDNTRRLALKSRSERTFTINMETRLLGETSENELLKLDGALNLRVLTARSEAMDERSSRIRFFPDGSSTGGSIQIQHDKEDATVNVDSFSGVATVQVNGD
jgi:general secretion pathway protein H